MTQQEICPLCYEKIVDDCNISISKSNHKFHTICLLSCMRGNTLLPNDTETTLPPGVYATIHNVQEYKQLLQDMGIPPETGKLIEPYLEELEAYERIVDKLYKKQIAGEENHKKLLKKCNPNKYKLFYGSS